MTVRIIDYVPRVAAVFFLATAAWIVGSGITDVRAEDFVRERTQPIQTPALNGQASHKVSDVEISALPEILSSRDQQLYEQIFTVQINGQWKRADTLIAQLENKELMGHVLAQRYLHPTKYRSHYKELKKWMAAYADLPQAAQIYKLALRRKPKNWRSPVAPKTLARGQRAKRYGGARQLAIPKKRRSRDQSREVRKIQRRVKGLLRRGYTLAVKRLLDDKKTKQLFSQAEYDQVKGQLGRAYFSAGRDEWALKWAGEATKRSGKYLLGAHFTAGLAAWRLGQTEKAAKHFEAATVEGAGDTWFHSGAAFWAARANLVARNPEKVVSYLNKAAIHPRTFYGMLARRMLGQPMDYRWQLSDKYGDVVGKVLATSRGRRAAALLQIGEIRNAERELQALAYGADETMANGLMVLATSAKLAALAIKLDARLYPAGGGLDSAAYPVPDWQPADGFRVDRALIYALIRQESRFNPKAKSGAGARGLMQLMPGTASFVAGDRSLRRSKRNVLYQPEVNLRLGQKYIEILLGDERIKGDLFLMAAAWNGGPGNLNKWRRNTNYMDDPLFFIESIPSRETRVFIERVLSNLWVYRNRLGQPTPSLDTIAAGNWPGYTALGQQALELAENE